MFLIALFVALVLVLSALYLRWDFTRARRTGGEYVGPIEHRLDRAKKDRFKKRIGCTCAGTCMPDRKHAKCFVCGELTCERTLVVIPGTLKRSTRNCHTLCSIKDPTQSRLSQQRTKRDFDKQTTPIRDELIETGTFGAQFPGVTREAIRAFEASGAEHAIVNDADAAFLNNSIASLGLGDVMFAETRGRKTYLRRIETESVS